MEADGEATGSRTEPTQRNSASLRPIAIAYMVPLLFLNFHATGSGYKCGESR
jgi:hypothetical protein